MQSDVIPAPVFVGGTGRSGTTAVFRILSSAPDIVAALPELRIHVDPHGALNLLDSMTIRWSPYTADRALHDFRDLVGDCSTSSRALARLSKAIAKLVPVSPPRYVGVSLAGHFGKKALQDALDRMTGELTIGASRGYWAGTDGLAMRPVIYETKPMTRGHAAHVISQFFASLYGSLAANAERYWVESTPYSVIHAPELLELFPSAKFVHVVRHPLDVVASYSKQTWGGSSVDRIARRIGAVYERWEQVSAALPENCYVDVRLEDLVGDASDAWQRIEALLDCPLASAVDASMLDARSLNQGRWQSDLRPSDADKASALLENHISRFGYG